MNLKISRLNINSLKVKSLFEWIIFGFMNLEASCSLIGLDFLSAPARQVAARALSYNKKLVVEFPIYKNYKTSIVSTNYYWSFPNIPARAINPWQCMNLYKELPYKPWLHLRARDFNSLDEIDKFLNQYRANSSDIKILVLYGDGAKLGGMAPTEVIPYLRSLGFRVGCVFNPTPVTRDNIEELNSFRAKLTANPDFMVSQTTYNATALELFCRMIPNSIEVIVGLGYWNENNNFTRLGINPIDEYDKKHCVPSDKFVNSLWALNPEGIYICDYSSKSKLIS